MGILIKAFSVESAAETEPCFYLHALINGKEIVNLFVFSF